MGFFDQLASAFENDDDLGEMGPAGLKKRVTYQTLTWQGPEPEGMAALFEKRDEAEVQAIVGQPLKDLAENSGIPLKFSCMQGTCGICDVKIDGQMVPACTAKMPNRDCKIEYKGSKAQQEYAKAKMKAMREAKKAGKTGVVEPVAAVKPKLDLEARLTAEKAAKKKGGGGGGWPFG